MTVCQNGDELLLGTSLSSLPPKICITGQPGVGKTALASRFPRPVLLDTEGGAGALDIPSFGRLNIFEQVLAAIKKLLAQKHAFETVIVDTIDALEPLVWAETCRRHGW